MGGGSVRAETLIATLWGHKGHKGHKGHAGPVGACEWAGAVIHDPA